MPCPSARLSWGASLWEVLLEAGITSKALWGCVLCQGQGRVLWESPGHSSGCLGHFIPYKYTEIMAFLIPAVGTGVSFGLSHHCHFQFFSFPLNCSFTSTL